MNLNLHSTQFSKQRSSQAHGFALIATISVMVLLVMVALAMLSLSTIELRQSENASYQQEAQANARMALMLAIGQLQDVAGSDQRITASADVFNDSSPAAKQPLWSGAWRSDRTEDGVTEIFSRDSATGSWEDIRTSGSNYDPQKPLAWLVSGDQPDPFQELPGQNGEDYITIQKEFTTLSGQTIDDVDVPLVHISSDKQSNGSYAWFSDDLSTKANIQLDNRFRPSEEDGLPAEDSVVEYFAPYGYGNFKEPALGTITEKDIPKIITLGTSGLATTTPTLALEASYDYTAYSQSLLTDTQNGGYKKDLTAFCTSRSDLGDWQNPDGDTYQAIKGEDSIIRDITDPTKDSPWHETFGPKFGLIRSWYQLIDEVSETGNKSKIDVHVPHNTSYGLSQQLIEHAAIEKLAGGNVSVPDLQNNDQVALHPVIAMVENQIVPCVQGSADPVKDEERELALKFYPRVVLWNPYNVTIKSQGYYVQTFLPAIFHINFQDNSMESLTKKEKRILIDLNCTNPSRTKNFNNPIYQAIFYIEPTEIGPGESLMFTPKANTEWTEDSNPGNLVLSASSGLNHFIVNSNLFVSKPAPDYNKVKILKDSPSYHLNFDSMRQRNRAVGRQRMWYLFKADDNGSSSWGNIHGNTENLLQSFYLSEDGYLSSDAPIDRLQSELLLNESSTIMPNQGRFTHRWRYIGENGGENIDGFSYYAPYTPFHAAPMANFNVRANWIMPGALNLFGRSRTGRHIYGPFMNSLYDLPMEPPSTGISGKNSYSPFGTMNQWGDVHRYILFDVPKPSYGVLSVGMLQHLNFSLRYDQPSYAVGNSYADIRYEMDKTSYNTSIFNTDQWYIDIHSYAYDSDNLAFRLQGENPNNKNLVYYDLAYEMNQALWDGYYFSNTPYDQSSQIETGEWTSPYYQVNTVDENAERCFSDRKEAFHHVSEYLTIPGGFNVNSTSIQAWKAFLASCAQKEKAYNNGKDTGNVFFSRTHPAIGDAYDPKSDIYDPDAWIGYRSLDDDALTELATAIVDEVRKRGPFLSVADFVNRRLKDDFEGDQTGLSGALQAAIDSTEINGAQRKGLNEYNEDDYDSFYNKAINESLQHNEYTYTHTGKNKNPLPFLNMKALPNSRTRHAHAFLQQGDLLQALGPRLRVRGDSFRIRVYGDSRSKTGKIMARAWAEAIVQRTPQPVMSDLPTSDPLHWDGIGPEPDPDKKQWGRRFTIVHFRWLNKEEI